MSGQCESAVAMLVFNRPETTARVFDVVRRARPRCLLVVADGPRHGRADDWARCAAARAVIDGVDWSCDVRTDFADHNLGIRRRVDTGLAWVFDNVDEAIILEDDIVPDPTFFRFCDAMLTRYRTNPRVFGVNGSCFIDVPPGERASYHFSRYPMVWGWATWARAWRHYDRAMRDWPTLENGRWLDDELKSPAAARYWSTVLRTNFRSGQHWDYAWVYSCWRHRAVMVTPNVNLASNIGFGARATHTRDIGNPFANLPTRPMAFPLRHPPKVMRDEICDAMTETAAYSGRFFVQPMFDAIRQHLRNGGTAT